jgi:hypothetical protein
VRTRNVVILVVGAQETPAHPTVLKIEL